MRRLDFPRAIPRLSALALALAMAHTAEAQFFTLTGDHGMAPVDLLPIPPAASVFDYAANTLFVGVGGAGSFSAMSGALLRGGSLTLGVGGTGNGSALFTGAGTRGEFLGTNTRLDVGSWGFGAMTVSAGAVVDASSTAGCLGFFCGSILGNGAGSTAALTVTGAGSEVATRFLIIGQTTVSGSGFGTAGGTTDATVNVLAGARLRSEQANVGNGPNTAGALGTERGLGHVVVDGIGSQWTVRHNPVDNLAAGMQIGNRTGGQADVTIRNGGKLLVDGSGGVGPNDFINLGTLGGRGTLTVTGAGSSVEVVGVNSVLQAGRSGVGAEGSFSVLAGATASALYMNIGRDQATGSVVVDGAGSRISQVGVGTINAGNNGGPAFTSIGRDGGNGSVMVSGGAQWFVSDGGGDGSATGSSPGFALGRGVGSTGSMTITGAGSRVEVVSTSLGLAPGIADNYNPFFGVGYDPGSTGQLTVSAGGKLILTGNAASTAADPRSTVLGIGGRGTALPGQGTATVTGLGSEIIVSGIDSQTNVGRGPGGTGALNVLDKGRFAGTILLVGAGGGTGIVNVDDATIAMSGVRDVPPVGAAVIVGRGGGVGTLNLGNAARMTIENNTLPGGMTIAGDSVESGGSGVVALNGGSSIVFSGTQTSTLHVGRSGAATMTLAGASLVDAGSGGIVNIGRGATGSGVMSLDGGSELRAGAVNVGSNGGTDAGVGALAVRNSSVVATTIDVGALGTITGDEGRLGGNMILGGVLSPDGASGRLTVDGGLAAAAGGRLLLDVGAAGSGFETDQLLLTLGSTFDFTGLDVSFTFLAGATPAAFLASGLFDLDTFLLALDSTGGTSGLSSAFAAGQTWNDVFAGATLTARAGSDVLALTLGANGDLAFATAPIPEPETWALLLAGLALVTRVARRRSRVAA